MPTKAKSRSRPKSVGRLDGSWAPLTSATRCQAPDPQTTAVIWEVWRRVGCCCKKAAAATTTTTLSGFEVMVTVVVQSYGLALIGSVPPIYWTLFQDFRSAAEQRDRKSTRLNS